MYYNDHVPPHFHAHYGGNEATFVIETLEVLAGQLPRRAAALVLEWAALHRAQLMANWDKVRQGVALDAIEPLD